LQVKLMDELDGLRAHQSAKHERVRRMSATNVPVTDDARQKAQEQLVSVLYFISS
jgi:hypothetical protein